MTTMLLAGTAINAFVAAIVGLLSARADDAGLRGFTLWMYGNLGRAGWGEIAVAAPMLLAVLLWLPREARVATMRCCSAIPKPSHLGVDVERLKRRATAGDRAGDWRCGVAGRRHRLRRPGGAACDPPARRPPATGCCCRPRRCWAQRC